jgi:hypothetical protein
LIKDPLLHLSTRVSSTTTLAAPAASSKPRSSLAVLIARRSTAPGAAIDPRDCVDLLISDILAYVTRDQTETSVLFELIRARHERRSMPITPISPSSKGKVVPDLPGRLPPSIVSLMTSLSSMNFESYRGYRSRRKSGRGRPLVHGPNSSRLALRDNQNAKASTRDNPGGNYHFRRDTSCSSWKMRTMREIMRGPCSESWRSARGQVAELAPFSGPGALFVNEFRSLLSFKDCPAANVMKWKEQSFQEFVDAVQTADDVASSERVASRLMQHLGFRWFAYLRVDGDQSVLISS